MALAVVPNLAGVRYWSDRVNSQVLHLPVLPQRGILPRNAARVGLCTLVVEGNPMSVPSYMREPRFVATLGALSMEPLVDVPSHTEGADQTWHDAGAIPLVGPEPAYLELVRDGVDGVVVRGPEDVLDVIRRLTSPDTNQR